MDSKEHIAITERYLAHNYSPLDVVISAAEGAWVNDVDGKRYLDMLSAYSAVNFGHCNKRLCAVALEQLKRLTLTSRAFYNDQLGLLGQELCELCGMDMMLPMTSGAEAVETAIKAARRWGYEVKGVAPEQAEIICFTGNFHGRTTTISGFSTSEDSKRSFGPFTPGFQIASFGDIKSVEALCKATTVAVLVEPIQGEGGVIIPPTGFLQQLRDLCTKKRMLLLADEIQTGLCRTGEIFACDHEKVKPDLYMIGKSLGGGITPLSAVVGNKEVMQVFTPGSHGSTFGGNPFACRVGREVIALIKEEQPHRCAKELGEYLLGRLQTIKSPKIQAIRGRGLFIGVDIAEKYGKAKEFCKKLKNLGILCKDTRDQTIRFAPPLIIEKTELDWALERIERVFNE